MSIARRPLWTDLAACRGVGVDIFFSERAADIADAKAYCDRCEVRFLCAEYATAQNDLHGVWGGLTPDERDKAPASEDTEALVAQRGS